ncbi:hypothetical protein OSB04_031506 [Centaurea solstitialis]|uniref:Zinc finger PHD-type domain-containing protein n=1 Tax=Centaurea solstitialis TaxID=347529 RepID=A0AA38SH56_9ASTR|nr:hypothetical protein OSB04_031506 [Centaurea solstitialis]
MSEIKHFSHEEHSLKLIENWEEVVGVSHDNDEKGEVICCFGCREPILDGFVYGCTSCSHFLHEKCANLAPVINHHFHPFHPLTLVTRDIDCTWNCNVCDRRGLVKGFSYWCMICEFDACTKCGLGIAPKNEALIAFKHEGHPQHTLTLQLRSASFRCDACLAKDEDLFYTCDDCDFWMHKTCASLAHSIDLHHHHKHPLILVYSLPDNFYNFWYYCEFCNKFILKNGWLYHCANCRYFAHIKCALNANIPSDSVGTSLVEEHVNEFMHFPMLDAFTDPLNLLHLERVSLDDNGASEISHWSHGHPLILNVEPRGNNMSNISCDPIEVCNGCVRHLSLPYYSCKHGCSFTLHKYCAELPLTLEHQLHPDHTLELIDTSKDKYYHRCNGCFSYGNTFAYKCETCKFYLDVNCANLPNTIIHKSHKHPLTQVIDPKPGCNACALTSSGVSFACEDCNFQLDMFCAIQSPHFLTHKYCKGHEIPLTYPPVEDHPEDFYCDICEKEMHPKRPLYHCNKCKNSFHLHCINRIDFFANVKLDGTRMTSYHKHPLTFVRRKKTSLYVCFGCNLDINGRLMLECRTGTCPYRICYHCYLIGFE